MFSFVIETFSHVLIPVLRWARGLLAGLVIVLLMIQFDVEGDHVIIMMWLAAQSASGDGEIWETIRRIMRGEVSPKI